MNHDRLPRAEGVGAAGASASRRPSCRFGHRSPLIPITHDRAERLPQQDDRRRARPYAPAMEWRRDDGHFVSDDPQLVDLERVHRWLSDESYWAAGRPFEVVAEFRRELGDTRLLYAAGLRRSAFCRWVTDSATFGWLCDVFVDSDHRGSGLGVFLVESAMAHPAVEGLRLLLLGTRDAHGLYSRFGFVPPRRRSWNDDRFRSRTRIPDARRWAVTHEPGRRPDQSWVDQAVERARRSGGPARAVRGNGARGGWVLHGRHGGPHPVL